MGDGAHDNFLDRKDPPKDYVVDWRGYYVGQEIYDGMVAEIASLRALCDLAPKPSQPSNHQSMSDATMPDIHRCGPDLIARIDELARSRNIDPINPEYDSGNGWIYLLLACRRELLR